MFYKTQMYQIFVISLLLGLNLWAQTAEQFLNADLQKGIRALNKNVRFYHYFQMHDSNGNLYSASYFANAELRSRLAYSRLDQVRYSHWNPNTPFGDYMNAGAGLYAAIDPAVSHQLDNSKFYFGDTALEINVPVGTKYLDVVRPIAVSATTRQALVAEGYLTASDLPKFLPGGFYRDTLRLSFSPHTVRFRNLIQNILKNNGIGLIEFNWDTMIGGFCTRTGKNLASAFTFIGIPNGDGNNQQYVDRFSVNIITDYEVPNLTQEEAVVKNRVFKFRDVLSRIKKNPAQRSAIILQSYPDANEKLELTNKTYSCM